MSDEQQRLALAGYKLVHRFEDAQGCSVPTREEVGPEGERRLPDFNKCANIWDFGPGAEWEVWIVARPTRPVIVEEPPA